MGGQCPRLSHQLLLRCLLQEESPYYPALVGIIDDYPLGHPCGGQAQRNSNDKSRYYWNRHGKQTTSFRCPCLTLRRQGIKTFIVITYQLLTSHVERYKRWASLKAYSILNFMEILFWFVVIIITFMGISRLCQGASCGLSWIIVLLATVME